MKYFILGGFSSAFLLYGIALVVRRHRVDQPRRRSSTSWTSNVLLENGLLLAGIALLLVGLAFKMAAVPSTPGRPTCTRARRRRSPGSWRRRRRRPAFAALIRVIVVGFTAYANDWQPVIWVLAVLTLVVGAMLAVVQTNVKRMLAYSSISHAGFILVGVDAPGAGGNGDSRARRRALLPARLRRDGARHASASSRWWRAPATATSRSTRSAASPARRPVLAFTLTVFLLAQAGVPLTSGFVAKFGVIAAAVDARELRRSP